MKLFSTTNQLKAHFMTLYDPTKFVMHFNLRTNVDFISDCGDNFKKAVSLADMVHFIDEDKMVTHVDFECGTVFCPEAPTDIKRINRERRIIPGPFKIPKCIPSKARHNCFIDKENTSNVLLETKNL